MHCCAVAGLLFVALPARAGWSTRAISGSEVHLYVPSSAGTIGEGRGLILGLHGCTQSNDALRDRGNWEGAADRFGIAVALPQVPNGGVFAGCWDYYGASHTRTERHNGYLLALVDELLGDSTLGIDPAQVYIAGLSSGAGESVIMGCLAPDIFAGVGINAGPAPGTTLNEFALVSSSAQEASGVCENLAAGNVGHFSTQLVSIITGTSDFVVAQGYARVNADTFALIYGGALAESSFEVSALEGYEPEGTGTLFSDSMGSRISLILASGMGHAFPGGSGPGLEISFVASEGVNWPMYLAELFSTNNRRVGNTPPPDDGGAGDSGLADSSASDGGAEDRGVSLGDGGDAGAVRTDSGLRDGADGGADEEPAKSGCGCSASRGAAQRGWLVLLVAVFAFRQRWKRSFAEPPRSR